MKYRLLLSVVVLMVHPAAYGVIVKSNNFFIEAPNEPLANRIAVNAEKYRQEFAARWLGHPLKDWKWQTPIVVQTNLLWIHMENGYVMKPGNEFLWVDLRGHNEKEVEGMLRHEIAHIVMHREMDHGGDAPRWLQEGVSVAEEVLAGEFPKRYSDTLSTCKWNKLFLSEGIPNDISGNGFYGESGSIALFLYDNYGPEKLWKFYLVGRRASYEIASLIVLGATLEDVEGRWRKSIMSSESKYPRGFR